MEIAVISGKGGTGKSSISAAFATLTEKVVVADCDVDAANLYLLFSPSREDRETFISGYKAKIDYTACTSCKTCIDFCRFGAISLRDERIVITATSCDGCFLCSRICTQNAIQMVPGDESAMYWGSFRKGRMVYGRLAPGEENSGKLVSMVRQKARDIAEKNNIETVEEEVEIHPLIHDVECPKCGHTSAYFWEVQTRASDEPETKFLRCEKCRHTWRDYS